MLRQHYETDALDASTLLAAIFGFLPGSDARSRATVLAVADELSENGFVERYRTDQTDDGLSGKEGSFGTPSFWLVSALAIVGQTGRARDPMERLVKAASPLGLYAEEFDVETGRHLGNFPQAFSHLALVEAAARLVVARASRKWSVEGARRRSAASQRPLPAGAGAEPDSVCCPWWSLAFSSSSFAFDGAFVAHQSDPEVHLGDLLRHLPAALIAVRRASRSELR